MSNPNRRPNESWQKYQEQVRNTPPSPPEPIYFQQNYIDVVELLEQKMLNFIRLNPKLRSNIYNRKRFVQISESIIQINLIEFHEAYRLRFIESDFEHYCLNFINLLLPLLKDFLKEIRFSGYVFKYKFLLNKMTFEKIQGVRLIDGG